MSENEKKQDDKIRNLYGEKPDISVPDFLVTPPQSGSKSTKIIEDEVEVAFKFAFLGSGQGGSRIAETFYKMGYRRVAAVNTAEQDLNTINLENKLCFGKGGAGKDPKKAGEAFEKNKEDILDFCHRSFGDGYDRIFVCAGAGGGTGAGTVDPLARLSKQIQEAVGSNNKVGVILALPKKSEGKRVNANAFATLEHVYGMVNKGIVSPLILIDNEKINEVYPDLVVSKFWDVANQSVAGLFHLFNHTATKDSTYSAFDANDYKSLLDSGLIVYGASPVENWKDSVAISRAVRDNLNNNLLSGGVDLSTGNSAACIVIGGQEQLDNITQSSLDQALLKPGNVVHRGIYNGDKSNLMIFTAVGGLGHPTAKCGELRRAGDC
jgi:cell division protein FtsZ